MRAWKLRVCRECGEHHGRFHDGCETYRNPMFPQMTEHAGIDEVRVVALDDVVEALRGGWPVPNRTRVSDAAADFIEQRYAAPTTSTQPPEQGARKEPSDG